LKLSSPLTTSRHTRTPGRCCRPKPAAWHAVLLLCGRSRAIGGCRRLVLVRDRAEAARSQASKRGSSPAHLGDTMRRCPMTPIFSSRSMFLSRWPILVGGVTSAVTAPFDAREWLSAKCSSWRDRQPARAYSAPGLELGLRRSGGGSDCEQPRPRHSLKLPVQSYSASLPRHDIPGKFPPAKWRASQVSPWSARH